jgi:[ribosomal protein S5]-alanine N-acetyltransferase
MTQLETERLILRPIVPTDQTVLEALWADPQVMRFLPTGQPRDREAVQALLDYLVGHWRAHGFGVWAVRLKGQDELIGYCGLQYLHAEPGGIDAETVRGLHEVELLYGIASAYWGKGYGREAARAAFRYGFETLHIPRIIAAIHPDNLASRRILEGLEMREDPRLVFYGYCPHFSLTREEYLAG